MMEAKLIKKIVYTGTIETLTGLHIGGTNAQLNIGGPDKFVVRNPINQKPYIPGSSLKGKLRSLVEIANGETDGG
ncbi:MAG: type III-A CRISPR-associated RAMP protein Csm3, partial [Paludibacteraceae bacterium]|nr:type III-A CRISPR-associated RAMP protein Csm3 [Paludibacteraceae bacterium]